MIRFLAWTAQLVLLGLGGYHAVVALWGWPDRSPAPPGERRRRFRVVVPAHDEAGVIEGLLEDLRRLDYPADRYAVWVIADRCADDTAAIAARHAHVDERRDGVGGKGAALAWHLARRPLADDEALVVLDADNRVPPELLARIADELDAGHDVVQAYLDVTNPDASPVATASALSYWAGNRMVQLARTNLGWSADLGGTGMALTPSALAAAGGFGDELTEDQELGARLALAGVPVVWLHDLRIRDEKPAGLGAAVGQRARWMAGRRRVARRYAPRLWREAVRRRSPALFDQGLRLVQPGRSFVAGLVAGLAVAAATTRHRWLLPWPVLAGAAAIQVLEPLPFLAKDGVPARYLARYPFLALLAALWLPIRVVSRRVSGWYHTPHGGVRPPSTS
ncbi:MAG TPA: glycosyltransferase [Actinobacteria bacterium]|nr:glycosyltransferase [Actinomycetota bacterium]